MSNIEQEISDFQAVVEDAFDTRVSTLKNELARLSAIRDDCEGRLESYLSWTPPSTTDNTQSMQTDLPGKIDWSHFVDTRYYDVFGERKPKHRLSGIIASEVQIRELFGGRKENLGSLINLAGEYLIGFESYAKTHTITQYSIYKHKEYNWKGDENIAHPYRPDLLSPEKQADFLIRMYQTDRKIARGLLSNLTRLSGTPLIMHAVGGKDDKQLVQVLSESNVVVSEEITAWRESLNLADIKEIDDLLAALGSIHKDFFLMESVEPLDNYAAATEGISYKEWPNIDDNGTAYEESEPSQPNTYHEPAEEEREQFFIGLKQVFQDTRILSKIVSGLCQGEKTDCINAEDKDMLFYRLSGNNRPEELRKIHWQTKCSEKPGKKNKPRHPNELYYLLSNMYERSVSDVQGRVRDFFEFDDTTTKLVESAFKDEKANPKSGIGTKGQSAPQVFQETMHRICKAGFPVKKKK